MEEFNKQLCDERHRELEKKHDDILSFLKELKEGQERMQQQLFIDNGAESIQSKINRHDRWIKGVCITIMVLVIPVLLLFVRAIIDFFVQ